MNLLQLLQERIRLAVSGLVDDPAPYVAMVKPAQDAKHGDYQANCAMSLAKALKKKPPEVAKEIIDRLPQDDLFDAIDVAGPGFINFRYRTQWLAQQIQALGKDLRLGVPAPKPARTYVIDYSSPNVAKPMHVGHLRSTIIGDSLARLLRFLGHKVIADNHLGDWGLQFGMLLHGFKHWRDEEALKKAPVREMVRLYVLVRQLIDPAEKIEEQREAARKQKALEKFECELARKYSPAALERLLQDLAQCREETSKLHKGDPENVKLWQQFMPWCLEVIDRAYRRLEVRFDHTHGESYYNPMLPAVVDDLVNKGIARDSEGAVAIFFGEDEPAAIVRSSHGAFTYTTTDLATIRHRMQEWRPDAILYVVDFRQKLHFQHLFDAAKRWGYGQVELKHISFGSVLGKDKKPIKTREGGAIELEELLDEAVKHAQETYERTRQERQDRGEEVPELSSQELQQVYEAVGYGAVKYADLSQNRESDYVFEWDKMLATDGNTATYMQYAYVRNRGIFRKGDEDPAMLRQQPPPVLLEQPEERALALALLRFPEALDSAAADNRPNLITAYLWDLANAYSGFYQKCSVLKAETPALRLSRLLLCDLTGRVIQKGLDLLGIRTIERM